MVLYSHLFKCFPQLMMIHTVRGIDVAAETEVEVFLEFPYLLFDPANVGNLISGSSSFSKPSLDIWKFLVHITLKILSMTLLAWERSAVVQWLAHSLVLPFLGINKIKKPK